MYPLLFLLNVSKLCLISSSHILFLLVYRLFSIFIFFGIDLLTTTLLNWWLGYWMFPPFRLQWHQFFVITLLGISLWLLSIVGWFFLMKCSAIAFSLHCWQCFCCGVIWRRKVVILWYVYNCTAPTIVACFTQILLSHSNAEVMLLLGFSATAFLWIASFFFSFFCTLG